MTSKTTVPIPETPGQPGTKRADELKPGDWLAWNDGFEHLTDLVEVLGAHSRAGDVVLVLAAPHSGPFPVTVHAGFHVLLARAEEIEAGEAAAYRKAAADQLECIADLFRIHEDLPIPGAHEGLHVGIQCKTIAEVELAGKLLGVEPAISGAQTHVSFPERSPSDRYGLEPRPASISWYSYEKRVPAAEPEPAAADTGLDFSEPDRLAEPTATAMPAGVDGRKVGGRANFKPRS
jgi:hypothetical protein